MGPQNGAIFPRGSLESTRNGPILTQIGPGLARKSPGATRGWLGGAWGGFFVRGDCCERVDSWEEIFGLLNFCCTREVVLFLRGASYREAHPRLACRLGRFAAERHRRPLTPPPVREMGEGGWLVGTGGGDYSIYLISKGACPLCIPHGGEHSPAPPSYEAGLRPPRTPRFRRKVGAFLQAGRFRWLRCYPPPAPSRKGNKWGRVACWYGRGTLFF